VTGYRWPALRLVPEEPDQVLRLASFREQHPTVFTWEGTGYWRAQIPEAAGETVITRYGSRPELLPVTVCQLT
jgi:hypothetical protein